MQVALAAFGAVAAGPFEPGLAVLVQALFLLLGTAQTLAEGLQVCPYSPAVTSSSGVAAQTDRQTLQRARRGRNTGSPSGPGSVGQSLASMR